MLYEVITVVGVVAGDGGFHVAESLGAGAEAGLGGQDTGHGVAASFVFQGLGQVHEAAALGVDGQPGAGEVLDASADVGARGDGGGLGFGEAAAEVEAVQFGPVV